MIDVIMPVPRSSANLVENCLVNLQRFTDVPFRVIAVLDGGARSDWDVEFMLESYKIEYAITHHLQPIYFNRCIDSVIDILRYKLVALVPPEYLVTDEQWFGKMQQVFLKDPHVFVVDAAPNTESTSLVPIRRNVHTICPPSTRFAMMQSRALEQIRVGHLAVEPVVWLEQKSLEQGGTVWSAPGVNIQKVDCKKHPTWLEPSVPQIQSE